MPKEFLKNFTVTLQCYGYAAYRNLSTKGPIPLLGCMAYTSWCFEKALDNDPQSADHVLLLIQQLYRLERRLKKRNSTIAVVKRVREIYVLPILNEIETYLKQEKRRCFLKVVSQLR